MNENKYCTGCGVRLQDENILLEGYTSSLENTLCSRCFRMKNYGEYQVVTKSNEEYLQILKSVDETKDLVLYMVDLLNISKDITQIRSVLNNHMILVLTKRDVLPKSVKDEKIKEYFSEIGLSYEDIAIISPKNNYNIDVLLSMIKKYKSSKNVYVVGHTNVGKSTLINKLIKNYSENTCDLTISPLPSTTLNKVIIPLSDDLNLIDTPGLIDRGSITNYVALEELKKISPKKEIKPKTYQIKQGQCLVIGNYVRIDYQNGEKNSFTVFASNALKIRKMNMKRQDILKDKAKTSYEVGYHQDLVINGLGFIKIVEKADIDVYVDKNVETFIRESLI